MSGQGGKTPDVGKLKKVFLDVRDDIASAIKSGEDVDLFFVPKARPVKTAQPVTYHVTDGELERLRSCSRAPRLSGMSMLMWGGFIGSFTSGMKALYTFVYTPKFILTAEHLSKLTPEQVEARINLRFDSQVDITVCIVFFLVACCLTIARWNIDKSETVEKEIEKLVDRHNEDLPQN